MWIRKCLGQSRDPEDRDSKKPVLGTVKQTRKGEKLQALCGAERRGEVQEALRRGWEGPLFCRDTASPSAAAFHC